MKCQISKGEQEFLKNYENVYYHPLTRWGAWCIDSRVSNEVDFTCARLRAIRLQLCGIPIGNPTPSLTII